MRTAATTLSAAILSALAAACQPGEDREAPVATATAGDAAGAVVTPGAEPPRTVESSAAGPRFSAIAADETIRFTGTEPFWGGTVRGAELVYSTPENQAGEAIAVRRFAGNNGLGFSGSRNGAPLDMTITPGACSDGMSDRNYPFTVTLKLGEEQRNGCAWTDRTPFTGAANP